VRAADRPWCVVVIERRRELTLRSGIDANYRA
jgi:hypothetical protein